MGKFLKKKKICNEKKLKERRKKKKKTLWKPFAEEIPHEKKKVNEEANGGGRGRGEIRIRMRGTKETAFVKASGKMFTREKVYKNQINSSFYKKKAEHSSLKRKTFFFFFYTIVINIFKIESENVKAPMAISVR